MNVLVYLETWDGKYKKLSFELVSFAVALAERLNSKAYGITLSDVSEDEIQKLSYYGLENLILCKDEIFKLLDNKTHSDVLFKIAHKYNIGYLVFPHNNNGKSLAPVVAVKLNASYISGVTGLPESINPFIITKKVFTGKAYARVKANFEKVIVSLLQNAFGVIEKKVNISVINEDIRASSDTKHIKLEEVQKYTAKVLLTDAEIVVSGGRGMKGPENWHYLEALAEELNAATACTRPVSDDGWRPAHEHVGQTGKIIAPNLYIACGISGAIQHVAGVSSSKYIIAINKDPEAPIFEVADYGVVGDVLQVLPSLTEEIRKVKK
ncbi:MAG: electron transfer flavoprotein subunit alpha/FixB family protein [Bacteroidales bacterium]|nr:electron transfer flavoprotein subunit alpha/FixB family protein [Bacteroidales bacterium]